MFVLCFSKELLEIEQPGYESYYLVSIICWFYVHGFTVYSLIMNKALLSTPLQQTYNLT
jgi:hypothetical protein